MERESSPALDELEARLGISKSKDSTPTTVRVGRLNMEDRGSPFTTPNKEPRGRYSSASSSVSSAVEATAYAVAQAVSPPGTRVRVYSDLSEGDKPHYRRPVRTSLNSTDETGRSKTRRSRSRARESSDFASNLPTSSSATGTPHKQLTEDAVEEMKRRFLSGNGSPAVTPIKSSVTSSAGSATRRRSRSRSRPRASLGDADSTTPLRGSPALRKAASSSSLRSSTLSQRTDDMDFGFETDLGVDSEYGGFTLMPDRTGESTLPLRIPHNRTGNSELTQLDRDLTGATTAGFTSVPEQSSQFSTDDSLKGRYDTIRTQRTGDRAMGYGFSATVASVTAPLRPQRTGEKAGAVVTRQVTGNREIRSQRTGDKVVRIQTTDTKSGDISNTTSFKDSVAVMDRPPLVAMSSVSSSDSLGYFPKTRRPADEESLASINLGMRGLAVGHKPGTFSTSSVASSGYESSVSSIPDLMSDVSDTTSSRSSLPPSTPPLSPPLRSQGGSLPGSDARNITPTRGKRAQTFSSLIGLPIPEQIPPDARCEGCRMPLFSTQFGGKFVTVPEEPSSTGALPKRYHTACFKCKICGEVFEEKEGGHAVFVRVEEGACHVRVSLLRDIPDHMDAHNPV
jgi:hypothetical protein